jgi:hypothetical protein
MPCESNSEEQVSRVPVVRYAPRVPCCQRIAWDLSSRRQPPLKLPDRRLRYRLTMVICYWKIRYEDRA